MFALHSNLVLFKFYSFPNQTHAHCIFTFQSGSIQIFSSSPLVAQSKSFTFQSGSIQIFSSSPLVAQSKSFTFQSGSIQIMVKTIIDKFKKSLHSNLVLFKSIITLYKFCIIWLYIPIWFYSNVNYYFRKFSCEFSLHSNLVLFKSCSCPSWCVLMNFFTFQSGSIQMYVKCFLDAFYNFFTFQSGSIQMLPAHWWLKPSVILYIPIWFYSNVAHDRSICTLNSLYIPIWFYSNGFLFVPSFLSTNLYIPIWFYSNGCSLFLFISICILYIPIWFYSNGGYGYVIEFIKKDFTFQSGSIQIWPSLKFSEKSIILYIPIWFYSNRCGQLRVIIRKLLYIPIWFYSNGGGYNYRGRYFLFTFQSGSIQIVL